MSAVDPELTDAVGRVFSDLTVSMHESPAGGEGSDARATAWSHIEEAGITSLLIPEQRGGFGGSWMDVQAVLHLAGFHALPLPVGETLLVRGLLARAGMEAPPGAASFGICPDGELAESPGAPLRFSGEIREVPWGRTADWVLIGCSAREPHGRCLLAERAQITSIRQGANMAGEPRDTLVLRDAKVTPVAVETVSLLWLGALLRAAQTGGALECVLGLSVRHVSERSQFGRPLAQFQAIQQQLAVLAEETAACKCAAAAAAVALESGEGSLEIAAAKLRANLAAARGAFIAHQCHGAIGMTMEHPLQRSTRRLWSWRAEFGNDRHWALWLGEEVQRSSPEGVWSMLAARGDRVT